MPNKITLVVRFRMSESAKKEFTTKLQGVFRHIVKEETFVEASLVQDSVVVRLLLVSAMLFTKSCCQPSRTYRDFVRMKSAKCS